jgi:nucleoid DNA-binding protein
MSRHRGFSREYALTFTTLLSTLLSYRVRDTLFNPPVFCEGDSMAGKNAAKKAMTKSAILTELAGSIDLPKGKVADLLAALEKLIYREVGKKGPGVFTIPGVVKLEQKKKKATKERMGRNPQTGQPQLIKAKPATTVVRARVLKALKETVK